MDDTQLSSFIRSDPAPQAEPDGVPGPLIPAAGHNNPPSPISVETLQATLAEGYGDLTARRDDLVANVEKYLTIENDDDDAKATDYCALVGAAHSKADEQHRVEKAPYLEGGRIVDAFFNGIRAPLKSARDQVIRASVAYKDKKQKAAVAEQQRIARLAREEEQRKAAEAAIAEAKAKGAATLEKAIVAETVAKAATETRIVAEATAEAVAAAPQATTRVHSSYGVSSLSYEWAHRVTDLSKVPAQFLMLNEDAVKAHIKARPNKKEAPAAVAGIEFYEKPKGNFR